MVTAPVKPADVTISAYLEGLNMATSLAVAAELKRSSVRRIGWGRILFRVAASFLKVYFVRKKCMEGTEGFISARLAAIYTLVGDLKLWEYQMRTREGKGLLPPVTRQEVNRFCNEYDSSRE